ncbi:berberine bridge enzyme-like 23 [Dioscorea cayenensis subsp. rotundata]|uniref:Berberine bridge enzyme-like 23 n=1 Tax=Dioscorea cayennensis subsp. rotundata TaxID=55577 RepID=A0AB40B1S5_DIOCR|nr:berberine bridge enzyme-like 23 [Dioscorea cayenensis subsp. rotundata]
MISILALILLSQVPSPTTALIPTHEAFLHCVSLHSPPSTNHSQELLYFPNTTSYSSLYISTIYNLRFASTTSNSALTPLFIVAPTQDVHVQATVICTRNLGLHLRVRSGGHDYEGLSYRSYDHRPFIMLDLAKFRSVTVDVEHDTALVEVGATLGELYYKIAEKSPVHSFPAGICPSVGVGGHISGGGMGNLVRKYGLAADNVLDVKLVDVNGKVLDRKSMGEDLFWAIRGGGGASFGVILSWTVRLVPVTPKVAVFTMHKGLADGVLDLLDKWQRISSKLHENVYMEAAIRQPMYNGTKGMEALFNFQFMGGCEELLGIMKENFPELGVEAKDCKEMSWIQSVMYYAGYRNGEPLETLLNRSSVSGIYVKGKSDFVEEPIARDAWKGIWDEFVGVSGRSLLMYMAPYGGKMDEIPESETPFPHRKGSLYNIQYLVAWRNGSANESDESLRVIRRLYKHMRPYVSKNPRAAYVNFRDLDLGMNKDAISYSGAKVWGKHYFKSNFKRLALVKGQVDSENFFRNEQSIPPLYRSE